MSSEPGDDRRAIEVMIREIHTIPTVIADQVGALRPVLRELVAEIDGEDPLVTSPPEIVLTGGGDSNFADIAARLDFERGAGVRCRAPEAQEFTRYEVRYVPVTPRPPVLIAASYSGEVGRTIEAVLTAKYDGWRTVALTGRPHSRLAEAADHVVPMDAPSLGFSPGTSTYVAMLCALYVLAAELARARGRDLAADSIDRALAAAPDLAVATLASVRDPAGAAAELLAHASVSTFLGAGPSRETAAFGAAKLFEGPQRHVVVQDLEEWAHAQYFVSGRATPVVVVAPSGASRDRADELLAEISVIGAPTIFIGDVADGRLALLAICTLPVASTVDESISSLFTGPPVALTASTSLDCSGREATASRPRSGSANIYETIHRAIIGEPA